MTGALLALALAANSVGVNLPWPYDAQPPMFADVVKTLRFMDSVDRTRRANKDANGWPTEDCEIGLWFDPANRHGTYAISFTGQATVTGLDDFAVSGVSYNAGTNVTTATGTVTNTGPSAARVRFTSTKRLPTDSPGTGITNIKIMRPITAGSATPHATTDVIDGPITVLAQHFNGPVRFMDWTRTNYNPQTTWATRQLPTYSYYTIQADGRGGAELGVAWEDVIRLANYVQRDAWINIPQSATDDYIIRLAQVMKCGSDGVQPWAVTPGTASSACAAGTPTYPPLDAGLNLYVEFANELWNFALNWSNTQYNNEMLAGGSNLEFDGVQSTGRWMMKQGIRTSNIFRSVFGDAAMPYTGTARIRPIWASWIANANGFMSYIATFLLGWYNNLDGAMTVTPHPPRYYFWGAGGAPYRDPASGYTATTVWTTAQGDLAAGAFDARYQVDSRMAAVMGLVHISYEGGPELLGNDTQARTINADSRMRTLVAAQHQEAVAAGVSTIVYYTAAGNAPWEFTPSVYGLTTPKMQAIDDIVAAATYPVTYGPAIPVTLDGNGWILDSKSTTPSSPGTGAVTLTDGTPGTARQWTAYLVRAGSAYTSSTVTLSRTGTGTPLVYLDGVLLSSSDGGTTWAAGALATGLHGVVVRASSGSVTLNSVAVDGTTSGGGGVVVTSITVAPTTATVAIGSTQAFSCTAYWSDASVTDCTATASWSSSATGVASVSGATATGVAAGSATITATYSGRTATAALTVPAAGVRSTKLQGLKLKHARLR